MGKQQRSKAPPRKRSVTRSVTLRPSQWAKLGRMADKHTGGDVSSLLAQMIDATAA